MRLKTAQEIDAIGRAGEIVAGVLALVGFGGLALLRRRLCM